MTTVLAMGTRRILLLVSIAPLAVAACGGDDEPRATGTSTPAATSTIAPRETPTAAATPARETSKPRRRKRQTFPTDAERRAAEQTPRPVGSDGRVRVQFTLAAGRSDPTTVAVPAGAPVELTFLSADGRPHVVRLSERRNPIAVGSADASTVEVGKLDPGTIAVTVDGRRAARLRVVSPR